MEENAAVSFFSHMTGPAPTSAADFFGSSGGIGVSTTASSSSGQTAPMKGHDWELGGLIEFHPFVYADLQGSLLAVAVNNYSVCALFLRQAKLAISSLETLIQEDPPRNMVDPVVFNLCTLYEISSAPDLSTAKKRVLLRIATLFHLTDPLLNANSFRLN
jgi:hypothetical protein